jgi:polyvinyl alcohol dehydrogenase (cytochrome)
MNFFAAKYSAAAFVLAASLCLLHAQTAPQPARRIGSEIGFGILQQHCMNCHGNPNAPKAAPIATLRNLSPEKVYETLTSGSITAHAGLKLSDEQKQRASESLAGRLLGTAETGDAANMPNRCSANPPLADPASEPAWNGWGANRDNTRFQPSQAAGLSADQVPRLKLQWAFGFPAGVSSWGQPAVVSGRVFIGSDIGWIYSLDAKTGCVYWSFKTKAGMRNAISLGPIQGHGAAKYAVYFGDLKANAYALDAQTGRLLWTTHADQHFTSRSTAAPTLYEGRLFVPISSWEGFNAKQADYPCCTSRGSVVALDANTGREIWKFYTTPEPPKPTRKNSIGTQLYGPSGVSVWNSPTVDPKRHAVYFGTGEAAVGPVPQTSDAVVALDIDTGKLLWSHQTQAGDEFLVGCGGATKPENCPKVEGPDYDIGNSPILKTLANGKQIVIAGTKNGVVFALDPDKKGALLWSVMVSPNPLSGILWGGAADDKMAYFGMSGGGVAAVQLATGERVWFNPLEPPAGHGRAANSAAITAITGVAFSGARTGILYALASGDGHIVWQFDTARDFTTVNHVPAHGGTMASAGTTVAGGMLFVASGYSFAGADKTGNVLLAFAPER